MVKSYAGVHLEVDLTKETTKKIHYPIETLRKYLGGTALGAKTLYQQVPPDTKYNDPRNTVFIETGP